MELKSNSPQTSALAHRIERVCELTGASRTRVYEALKRGELQALKLGRATLVPDASVRAWLASLPRYAA